jgi:hypothetical protein
MNAGHVSRPLHWKRNRWGENSFSRARATPRKTNLTFPNEFLPGLKLAVERGIEVGPKGKSPRSPAFSPSPGDLPLDCIARGWDWMRGDPAGDGSSSGNSANKTAIFEHEDGRHGCWNGAIGVAIAGSCWAIWKRLPNISA